MHSKTFIADFPLFGTSWVTVSYFSNAPTYRIQSLDNEMPEAILFISEEGRWQQDGAGINHLSETLGNVIDQYAIG